MSHDAAFNKNQTSYGEPDGPSIVEAHSKILSPLGPALQFAGGSRLINTYDLEHPLNTIQYRTSYERYFSEFFLDSFSRICRTGFEDWFPSCIVRSRCQG